MNLFMLNMLMDNNSLYCNLIQNCIAAHFCIRLCVCVLHFVALHFNRICLFVFTYENDTLFNTKI